MNWMLTALLMLGLGVSVAACSDSDDNDSDNNKTEEQPVNSRPGDDDPEDINAGQTITQIINSQNGEDGDSLAFFLSQAEKGSTGDFLTCRYSYLSHTADGDAIWLTGRMAWPKSGVAKYIVGGCHITMTDNTSCPSENRDWKNDCGLVSLNLASEALVVFPDYEGYGCTMNRPHPYLCQEITARQVIDGIVAARDQFLDKRGGTLADGWKTVIVGYSQGGSVAMATHRYLELGFDGETPLADELRLAGSVCGDGPYVPLATLAKYINDDRIYMPVVAPLIMKGMCDTSPLLKGRYDVGSFLCADFLNSGISDWIDSKGVGTDDIQDRLCEYSIDHSKWSAKTHYTVPADEPTFVMWGQAWEEYTSWWSVPVGIQPMNAETGSKYTFGKGNGERWAPTTTLLKPAVVSYFAQEDGTAGGASQGDNALLRQALDANNLTKGWQPAHPIIVFHSKYDEVVPFVNYERARTAFQGNANFHGIVYDTSVQMHVSTGQAFFVYYAAPYVRDIFNGTAATMPTEKTETGLW